MTMQPVVEVRGATRRYGTVAAVDGATFDLQAGRIACLLGPSGCGKSTVLRMIAGLEPVDAGEIRIGGAIVSSPAFTAAPEHRGVGLVFQDNALFPHLDVRGNIGFGLSATPRRERGERIARLLEQFHIGHLAASWPHMLSGGEQQRVAIARALAREPALLLLDEPFSGLDGVLREHVRSALLDDLRRLQTSVLIVTHDPEEAMTIADDLILMAGGHVLQSGSPERCYREPASATAARLLGDMAVFPGRIAGERIKCALGTFPAEGFADGPAQLGLRPEALYLAENGAQATVRDVRFVGTGYRLDVDLAGHAITIRIRQGPPKPGETIALGADPAALRIYADQTG